MDLNNKEEVRKAIENGMSCYQRFGFKWKGAGNHPITKEKALELLPHFSPGMGYYELRLENTGIEQALVFVEYSEADML